MLDVAVSYNRYKFLGHEFLTWLWFVMENQPETLSKVDGELVSLAVGNRMVLENSHDDRVESVTIKGDQAGLEEGLLSLKKGAVVTELKLIYKAGDNEWHFSLKGESLNLSSLKPPQTAAAENKEEIEGAVLEKVYLYEKALALVERLYQAFIRLRISENWQTDVVPAIRQWLNA